MRRRVVCTAATLTAGATVGESLDVLLWAARLPCLLPMGRAAGDSYGGWGLTPVQLACS